MSEINRATVDATLAAQLTRALSALERVSKFIAPKLTLDEQLEASGPILLAKTLIQSVASALVPVPRKSFCAAVEPLTGAAARATIHPLLRSAGDEQ